MVQFVTVSMVGGTIRRKVIHRESFRASVLHHSENQAVLQSIATKKCLLTTPSLLSRGTQQTSESRSRTLVFPGVNRLPGVLSEPKLLLSWAGEGILLESTLSAVSATALVLSGER
jgi:hypothetical protein